MPVVIHEQFKLDAENLDTGFQPNQGKELTTDAILESMARLKKRPEIGELSTLIRESGQYLKGESDA